MRNNLRSAGDALYAIPAAIPRKQWMRAETACQSAGIAQEVGAAVVNLQKGWTENSDMNDLMQRDGGDALVALLKSAAEPVKSKSRYKLLGANDLRSMSPMVWRVRGVLPNEGLAVLFGPSGSGKSFLALDMAAAIPEGRPWFGCRVEASPVVYVALEGESGFKQRMAAWEAHTGRAQPDDMHMVLQPFVLTNPHDVKELAAVVPPGSVVFIDTLNRAAPTADENSSIDMGEILSAAKQLQCLTHGPVVLLHHTGKDGSKGPRGHSSLLANADTVIEVSRNEDRRQWKIAKAKDGKDGEVHRFMLQVEALGTDHYGDPITSCVVVRDTAAEDVRAVKLPQGGNQKLVLAVLRDLLQVAGSQKLKAAPSVCPLGLPAIELESALPCIAERMTCERSRRVTRAKEAIEGLVSRGVLCSQAGWIWFV